MYTWNCEVWVHLIKKINNSPHGITEIRDCRAPQVRVPAQVLPLTPRPLSQLFLLPGTLPQTEPTHSSSLCSKDPSVRSALTILKVVAHARHFPGPSCAPSPSSQFFLFLCDVPLRRYAVHVLTVFADCPPHWKASSLRKGALLLFLLRPTCLGQCWAHMAACPPLEPVSSNTE